MKHHREEEEGISGGFSLIVVSNTHRFSDHGTTELKPAAEASVLIRRPESNSEIMLLVVERRTVDPTRVDPGVTSESFPMKQRRLKASLQQVSSLVWK